MMTIEELRKEAAALGYRLVKKEPLPEMRPCSCGCKSVSEWKGPGYKYYKCIRCGHKGGRAKTPRKMIEAWNNSFDEEEKKE